MISKSEAQEIAQKFQSHILTRISRFLAAQARVGRVGGVIGYTDEDDTTKLQEARAILQANGWVVTVDTVNKTATIS